MKTKVKISISLLIPALIIVLGYQNCSDIKLDQQNLSSSVNFMKVGDICSLPALSKRDKIKLLFVVDMSASNATANRPPVDIEGSDVLAKRFLAIKNFLEQDCLNGNTNAKIAVVGFADTHIISPGTSCNKSQFKDFNGIQNVLDFYTTENDHLRQDCQNGGAPGGRCSYYTTNYDAGVSCAQSIINSDISTPDADGKDAFYMTFFLTDGEPFTGVEYQLGSSAYSNFKNQLIQKIINIRANAEENAAGFMLQPIFYGGNYLQRKDPSGQKQRVANDILTAMATEGLSEYKLLESINDLNLCDYLVSGTRTPYRLKQFAVTNLTMTKRGKYFLADSDMDGIPDTYEIDRGFDPQKPRSMFPTSHLLDGACGGLLADVCRASAHKNCGEPNAMGITACEVNKLGLTNGLDSNGDGFLDTMALIKGLSPNALSAVVDGDSMTEAEELRVGRDPKYPDDETPDNMLLKVQVEYLQNPIAGCPADQESIRYRIIQLPLISTLATSANDSISQKVPWLHHKTDENVLLFYYILTPANASLKGELKDQVYAKFVKLHKSGIVAEEGAFKKIGELHPTFGDSKE